VGRAFVSRWFAVVAAVICASAPASAQTGLVAAYAFDDGAGTIAKDVSGNALNGTLSNATWTAAGKYGVALSFNGTTSWVTVADAAVLDLTSAMTLEAWVKASAVADWRSVILKERAGGLCYALYASNTNSTPSAYIRRSADIDATSASTLPVNQWVHLAATYNGTSLILYMNGAPVASQAVTGSMATSTAALRIGGDSVWGEYFAGLIDEVRVYNRALSQSEIQTDMATPIGSGGTAPPDTTPPSVSVTSPANNAIIAGTTSLTDTASDNVGVAGVQFKVDGANAANEVVAPPFAITWNSASVATRCGVNILPG